MNQKQRFHQESQTPVNADVLLIRPVSKQQWELTKDKVNLIRKIGAGQFGEIWEGTLHESPRVPPIIVAVKVTKVIEENKEKVTEMYMEARLMRQYKHKNVVAFYGVVQERPDRAMIVMELVSGGSLKDHIRSTKEVRHHYERSKRITVGYLGVVTYKYGTWCQKRHPKHPFLQPKVNTHSLISVALEWFLRRACQDKALKCKLFPNHCRLLISVL
ncbi:unnamed protein product [Heligmosomoides polygyrus]|uniref:Protein kinase domain-containing protein n=1 Tax=Heligmosomoides polygyrus TaxID=6339 RepID=A0A183GKH6_HELPZ|nr:unnamed protein product [Heligmosomoides polygyrus]